MKILLTLSALFIVGCSAQPETSCNFLKETTGKRLSWGSNVPMVMHIDASVPLEFIPTIKDAAAVWNNAAGREIIKISKTIVNVSSVEKRDGLNVIYFLNTWSSSEDEQAYAKVYSLSGRIVETDIRINDFNFCFVDCNRLTDFKSLMIHELGHSLGLAHDKEKSSSVMFPYLNDNQFRHNLSELDTKNLRCEY